jgi:hypothetical protein
LRGVLAGATPCSRIISGGSLITDILAAVAPLVDGKPELAIETVAAAMMAAVTLRNVSTTLRQLFG